MTGQTKMTEARKQKHDCVIQVRARTTDLDLIDQACAAVGITRSAMIRHAAEAHARRVLANTAARAALQGEER